jgi:hypothetical protein
MNDHDLALIENVLNSLRNFFTVNGPQNLTACMNHVGESQHHTKAALLCGIRRGLVVRHAGKYHVTQNYYLRPECYHQ